MQSSASVEQTCTLRAAWLLLLMCAACGSDAPEASSIVSWLTAYNREVEITCPCRVSQGAFESQSECLRKQVLSQSTMDCLNQQFMTADSPELRETARCMAEACETRTTCISSHACDPASIDPCYDLPAACPMFDPQLLTRVFEACPDSILLAR